MPSTNMFTTLFLVMSPLLSHAQQHQQIPLKEDHRSLIIPLTVRPSTCDHHTRWLTCPQSSGDRTYTIESPFDGPTRLSLKAISEIQSYREVNTQPQSVLINVPLDRTQSGSLTLTSTKPNDALLQQDLEWVDTLVPGQDVPITHVGIRKGAMISMDAYATRLALETPYISLPDEIYDILVQATNPTPHQHSTGYDDVVDCSLLGRFPDIVLGLQSETDDEEDSEDVVDSELVITPKQYVLETEDRQCVLLVQRHRAEVVLGWAAVRGRGVVLDKLNGRTGFGR